MLTVAYCRVSTEEQAEDGFSIEGQADKLSAYATLRDLGTVTLLTDPGLSGKDMKRPGLQQLLAAVESGFVSHVLVWRLDRLSRNLSDLILLADTFGSHGVALHSVSENLDLSSAAGRMFYNILGTFAQYFREQLSENVRMGNDRAIKEGKHINRPKTGYDLLDGELVPNGDAIRVQEIFRLRAQGLSYAAIEERTGIRYSTVMSILQSRVYLGEIPHNGSWFPGRHEAIVTEEEWRVANRGFVPGRRRSGDPLSGKVRCGLCDRRMAVAQNGQGCVSYKCRHRGTGCALPARSNQGLARAALLGFELLSHDERLQAAVRRQLTGGRRAHPRGARRGRRQDAATTMTALSERRRKVLDLYVAGKISADGFQEEEERICASIEAARALASEEHRESRSKSDLEQRFDDVLATIQELDLPSVWAEADDDERRVLIEELLEWVTVYPDHLEVTVAGAPPLNVLFKEVGLKESENVSVGGGT